MDDPALMSLKEPERKKDPTYLAWQSFDPGATVTVRETELERHAPYTRKIPNGPDMQVPGWERVGDPGGQTVLTTTKLISVDDKKITLNQTTFVGRHPPSNDDVEVPTTRPPGTEFDFPFGTHANSREPIKKIESGSETLVIAGKSLQTKWWAVTRERTVFNEKQYLTAKVWFSDQVPGGIVKQLWQTWGHKKNDKFMVHEVTSFQGAPRPLAQNSLYEVLSSSFGTNEP